MTTTVTTQSGPIALPFTDVELTEAINLLPVEIGALTQAGMFPGEGIPTQFVEIDIVNGVVMALPVTGDGPPTVAKRDSTTAKIFRVPTVSHEDNLLATDVRNMLAQAGRSRNPETLANLFNNRLAKFKRKFQLTWEVMRMTALKGIVLDGAGNEVVNLFTAYGVTQKEVYFDLSNANADLQGACDQVIMLITQDLTDDTMDRVEAYVDRKFFNALIQHPKCEKFWLQAEQAQQLVNVVRGSDGNFRPREFTFGNITFKENPAVYPAWGGTNTKMIADNTGHAYPGGTQDSHISYIAPPDDVRMLNGADMNPEDAIYITTEALKHGRGIEMLGRMNVLPMWRRPKLLVTLKGGAGTSTVAIDGM